MTQAAPNFPVTTQAESYIVKRLRDHGAFIYPVSDQFPLKERIRRAILDNKLDAIICRAKLSDPKMRNVCATFRASLLRTIGTKTGKAIMSKINYTHALRAGERQAVLEGQIDGDVYADGEVWLCPDSVAEFRKNNQGENSAQSQPA